MGFSRLFHADRHHRFPYVTLERPNLFWACGGAVKEDRVCSLSLDKSVRSQAHDCGCCPCKGLNDVTDILLIIIMLVLHLHC